jgi:hypothetical protein
MMPTGLAARVVVPPLAGFVLVAAYVAAEALGFRAYAVSEAQTVSEAAARGEAARAVQLIAAGQSPDTAQRVRAGILDHVSHDLTPIEAAILGRHAELVRLLQRTGATHGDLRRATCFARMRLPKVLPDLAAGDAATAADHDVDLETTIEACAAPGARL